MSEESLQEFVRRLKDKQYGTAASAKGVLVREVRNKEERSKGLKEICTFFNLPEDFWDDKGRFTKSSFLFRLKRGDFTTRASAEASLSAMRWLPAAEREALKGEIGALFQGRPWRQPLSPRSKKPAAKRQVKEKVFRQEAASIHAKKSVQQTMQDVMKVVQDKKISSSFAMKLISSAVALHELIRHGEKEGLSRTEVYKLVLV